MQVKYVGDTDLLNRKDLFLPYKIRKEESLGMKSANLMMTYPNAHYKDFGLKIPHFGSSEAVVAIRKSKKAKRKQDDTAIDYNSVADYKGYKLDKYQKTAINSLKEGHDVIVSAPTGTGKTLIAEEIILYNLRHEKQTIYTAPLKALVDDKFEEFKREFGDDCVARLTGDYKTENALKYPIVVMTTEVYRNMVINRVARNITSKPETVVFDEIHSMGDLERGTVWEESIMASPKSTQIVGLSATVSNANKMTKWIERIHTPSDKKAVLISVPREQRHVPLHYYAYNPNTPGQLYDLEQEGISHEIFENSTVTNERLSTRQIGAITELNGIYEHNPVIQGRRVLNRIRSRECPKTKAEFKSTIVEIAKKAGVEISPTDSEFITDTLVANNKSAEAVIKANVRTYRMIDFANFSELSPDQVKALEDLGSITPVVDKKEKFGKKTIPAANSFLTHIEGVNSQRYKYEDVVRNIIKGLEIRSIPESEQLAESVARSFKTKKPNAFISFINSISVKREGLLFQDDAEAVIQNRIADTLRRQGLSKDVAESKAAAYAEQVREAFCSVYNKPEIDTISKAVRYSAGQCVTKHILKVPHNKNISSSAIEKIKQSFSPDQIKLLSLFGFISNLKAVNGITKVYDIEKQSKSDANFVKGIKLISSYSAQRIKTKEEFIDQVITSKFKRFKAFLSRQIKDSQSSGLRLSEIANSKELQTFLDEEFSDEKISVKSSQIMDSMLEGSPDKVISTRDILAKLIITEQEREKADTSEESFMFKFSRKSRNNAQHAQLKILGETLVAKDIDKGFFVLQKLQKTTKFSTTEHLKRAIRGAMIELSVPDADEKVENIIRHLTIPLSQEEIDASRVELLKKQAQGKIELKVGEIQKTSEEQAIALKKLAALYAYIDQEHPFTSKSPNNGIIKLMPSSTTGQETATFRTNLEAILTGLQEPKAAQKADSITQRLKSKIPNKTLEAEFSRGEGRVGRDIDYMPDLIGTLRKTKILPGLFFIFSRRRCGETLKECTERATVDLLTAEEKGQVQEIIEKHLKSGELLDTKFEPTKKLLLRGYAVHHAGKMPAYKSLVQDLAAQGLVKATFATETLAAGINYPTRTTIITSLNKPEGTSSGGIHSRTLKASEFQQMGGRAGRRGYDEKGNIVVVANNLDALQTAVNLAERMPEPVESHYRPSYGLVANLLMSNPSIQDLDNHFARSFLVEECSNTNEKDKLIAKLKSRTDDIVSIMMDKGYLEKTDNFGNYRVTAKGQIASMVKGVNELFLTEIITDPNILDIDNIDSKMFAGIISSVTYDSSNIHQKLRNNSTKPVVDAYNAAPPIMRVVLDQGLKNKLDEIIKKERELEDKNVLLQKSSNTSLKRNFISFNKWMAPFVQQWAGYPQANDMTDFWEELTGVMKNGELLKDAADFTRTISNTADLLNQIENIANYIDDNDLYRELAVDPLKIDRMKGLARKAFKEISKIRLH